MVMHVVQLGTYKTSDKDHHFEFPGSFNPFLPTFFLFFGGTGV
jgi:hypothetical protein